MDITVYIAALFFTQLANYGFVKTMNSRLDQPAETSLRSVYLLFGFLGLLLLPILLIVGYLIFTWWVPLLAFLVNALVFIPLICAVLLNPRGGGALYVLSCLPISAILTVVLFAIR
ncbi:MAG: hypothetical protein V3T84_13530 [Phycisphaerales bacterium]